MTHRVAFLGFSDFERNALASYFRLAHNRNPAYEQVATLTDAEFLVADADHGPSVQLVLVTERQPETVFVGATAPAGCTAWMMRPIDALQVMRELDAMVARTGAPVPSLDIGSRQTTVIQVPRRELPVPDLPDITELHDGAGHEVDQPAVVPAPASAAPAPLPAPPPAVSARPAVPSTAPAPLPAVLRRRTQPSPQLPPAEAPAPQASPPRALLVDDSALALRFLEARLSRWPLLIDRASSSSQALALLEGHSYDLVFLDVELGEGSEMDGLALCQHIKQSPSLLHSAVVMVSAHHTQMDRVRGALAGCDAYLGKPLDEAELRHVLLRQGLKATKDESAAPR